MAEDLSFLFADDLIAKPVVFGSQNTRGILDQPDQLEAGGVVQTTDYTLVIDASSLSPAPQYGDAIKVGGEDYKVNRFAKMDDGALVRLELSKV